IDAADSIPRRARDVARHRLAAAQSEAAIVGQNAPLAIYGPAGTCRQIDKLLDYLHWPVAVGRISRRLEAGSAPGCFLTVGISPDYGLARPPHGDPVICSTCLVHAGHL